MNFINFLYYGYDKKIRKECLAQICTTNRNHSKILNLWFASLMLILSFFAHNDMFFVDKQNEIIHVSYFLIAVIYGLLQLFFPLWSKHHAIFMAYVNILILISYSVIASTLQPYMAATTILVMLVLISIAYIDTIFTMIPTVLISAVAFIYFSWTVKPLNIWYQDVYNGAIFFTLSTVLHYSFSRGRMAQFVTLLENVKIQQELEISASFDALTQLLNRGRFFSMAGEILRSSHDEFMAFCIIDLDRFKEINDVLGHQMGDKAIQVAGLTIQERLGVDYEKKVDFLECAVREKRTIAGRLGGDEFVALVRGKKDKAEVLNLMQEIIDTLNKINLGKLNGIGASIGVAQIMPDDHDIDQLYNFADSVLYDSKKNGKNRVTFVQRKEEA